MQSLFEKYIQSISTKFSHHETSEMGYRADFEILLKGIFESIKVERIDHDAKAREGNKPDFVVIKHSVPIVYIEAKDIGVSLDKVEESDQMKRYFGYANLVLTDYVEFRFYRNGIPYEEPIKIASFDLKSRIITPIPEQYEHVAKTLLDFTQSHKEPIRSGAHLAKIMGGKAQRIRDNVRQFLAASTDQNAELIKVYQAIKELLVHDLTHHAFADMYAQTVVYGLFVARHNDKTQKDFSYQEARNLIPGSNPLLRDFFDYIFGPNFDTRLKYIVVELCDVFSHADIEELMKEYLKEDLWGKIHKGPDPVIYFYEDFLKEYDDVLRKKMGAYYTPLPVVWFIVRSVDYLLEKEFGLTAGLADTSKTTTGVHRVQILDPAVGTGTFISKVIGIIYERLLKKGQKGTWPSYVHHNLLPRLHGFELMMAPYTIAHLKLTIAFKETGFWNFHRRLGIYLTNSLEPGSIQGKMAVSFGFAESIAKESEEAAEIKNKKPIMVVLGNPPYSVSSQNKGEWIQGLIEDYKKGLNERKINLDDDYIKFIRFAEHFIEKNKTGIVAMITNNSFIDGITHRQMRKHLLETFDDIYILDLHGNSTKKEKAPGGGIDKNVFDIKQGVSISLFVRKVGDKKGLGAVHHAELYGKRELKFEALNEHDVGTIKWHILDLKNFNKKFVQTTWGKGFGSELNFFTPKGVDTILEYGEFFGISELFEEYGSGIITRNDDVAIQFNKDTLDSLIDDFKFLNEEELRKKYDIKDGTSWKLENAKEDVIQNKDVNKVSKVVYRPFDFRYTLFTQKSGGFLNRPVFSTMRHMLSTNLSLSTARIVPPNQDWDRILVSNTISDIHSASDQTYVFPLYLYSDDGTRKPNFRKEVIDKIEEKIGRKAPEDILDYVYAILYSLGYRKKYGDLLKIDFPRVPYPKDAKQFRSLVALGKELRELHLLESPKVDQFITTYPVAGSDMVDKLTYQDGQVFINKEQYFGNVPEAAWNFYIGGYQPAQKWLKDRKGRTLANADIEHYQKMIVALVETGRIMGEIDRAL